MTDKKPDEIAKPFVVQQTPSREAQDLDPQDLDPAEEFEASQRPVITGLIDGEPADEHLEQRIPPEEVEQRLADIRGNAPPKLRIHRLLDAAKLPTRVYPTDVGWDVYACLISDSGKPRSLMIPSCASRAVPLGIIAIAPPGYRIELCSRSGLALSSAHPLFVANAPGIVDPGFRGEMMAILYNGGHEAYWVKHEQRVAQMVVTPVVEVEISEINEREIPPGDRGEAGYGSSGE